jgi:hypothetical protein
MTWASAALEATASPRASIKELKMVEIRARNINGLLWGKDSKDARDLRSLSSR